ncbi:hypothetical protein C7S20_10595 [Christiangramia fulva]|uniref:Uncharacterized protein n=1 Tax=Christiangramia fulva TaxID=2126553 RepID=A0A2R3Z5Y0_9FLAO|nr:hypothetical protein [Christiangramia fulva]AVR45670.1 hypothetical protein C7S20_10595 [Christiangramia fulva]
MNYKQLGEFVYIPKTDGKPLKDKKDIKFNYYLSSRVNGKKIDVDITTKLFDDEQIYIRKACYRVGIGEIEGCVKENLINHMKSLGMDDENIPSSLINVGITPHAVRCLTKNSYKKERVE